MELHAPVCTKEERVLCAFTGRDLNYRDVKNARSAGPELREKSFR